MKVIIAGSRDIPEAYKHVVKAVLLSRFDITEVVSGTARGIDRAGERFAREERIRLKQFPAQWEVYGKSAGMIRNRKMAEYADALIAVWDGDSFGTPNMIRTAEKLGLKVFVHQVRVDREDE